VRIGVDVDDAFRPGVASRALVRQTAASGWQREARGRLAGAGRIRSSALPVAEQKGRPGTVTAVSVEKPRSVGLATANPDLPSPSHRHLPLDFAGLSMRGAVH